MRKELLQTFLTVGGRKGKIDFDELGINEVVELLRIANMEAVLKDFGEVDVQRRWPSVEKARKRLGWRARIEVEDGVAATVRWLREHPLRERQRAPARG